MLASAKLRNDSRAHRRPVPSELSTPQATINTPYANTSFGTRCHPLSSDTTQAESRHLLIAEISNQAPASLNTPQGIQRSIVAHPL